MKNHFWTICSAAALLTGSIALAQSRIVMRADIPFEFQAPGVTLPAGSYELKTGIAQGVVQLACGECKASAMLITIPAQANTVKDRSALVFHRYGDRYFLSEVWQAGRDSGFLLRKTKAEAEMAVAKTNEPSNVLVALHR